ncbi:MAG: copper resistance protein CopB [Sphingomonadales bacterium 35-56-22]|uniref:copper resistance protein B n=1 Tax=Sphingorhabdus sp. TaxID=1902408 RepID=UPI000BD869C2|nr:copper resistance protein B [Sphingorhabdus sp.]OYY14343.1 MAG: copper resistance protein CopB [Sphingomonadales bacterium 35-56-22]OYY96410.1 MAG: copper resistance protein CopB [Sphingomonadales bacterium 28-56-43]OYZ59397.1 MAG: copper resistance protein CopB [Sphingomonadales bacterium 24-56-14]OZA81875.1 MAG: copper resistance protein CopB [Sphingomonadales bacterium 39-57-19]HQS13571.1 copper resistance protein B [Sphingorhabdus sp.]
MKRTLLLSAAMLLPSAAYAEQDHSAHQGHDMPAEQTKAEAPPVATDPHAGHDMGNMEEVPAEPADPHAGHDMSAMPADDSAESDVGEASAPAPPGDHAADAVFGAEVMARSRKELAYEVGGMGYSLVMLDLAEVGFQNGRETYRFEGEAFTGGNINRFGVKFEGEGAFGGRLDDLELQALYSRAIAPYWNLQAGVRHDIKPDPSRTYLVAGVEGIAPYWFKVNAATFLSNKGEVRARVEASYDQRITQKLILQPRVEANFSFQDIPAIGVGSGLTDFEAGLRLRYEIKQEIAPYIGVEWRKQTGVTARFARIAGEDPDTVSLVAGIRIWF